MTEIKTLDVVRTHLVMSDGSEVEIVTYWDIAARKVLKIEYTEVNNE